MTNQDSIGITPFQQGEKTLEQLSLREKCSYSEFSCSVYSRILNEYGEILLSLQVESGCRKIRTRKNPNTNTFYAVFRIYEQ